MCCPLWWLTLEGMWSSSSYCRKSQTCREQRGWRHLTHSSSPCETIPLPSKSETLSLQSRNEHQGEASVPFIPSVPPNWKLGNNIIQCRSLLLQCFFDVARNLLCAQTEIPLQKNMTALSRGYWPVLQSIELPVYVGSRQILGRDFTVG